MILQVSWRSGRTDPWRCRSPARWHPGSRGRGRPALVALVVPAPLRQHPLQRPVPGSDDVAAGAGAARPGSGSRRPDLSNGGGPDARADHPGRGRASTTVGLSPPRADTCGRRAFKMVRAAGPGRRVRPSWCRSSSAAWTWTTSTFWIAGAVSRNSGVHSTFATPAAKPCRAPRIRHPGTGAWVGRQARGQVESAGRRFISSGQLPRVAS